jgi:hypothetical protein
MLRVCAYSSTSHLNLTRNRLFIVTLLYAELTCGARHFLFKSKCVAFLLLTKILYVDVMFTMSYEFLTGV